MKERNRGFSLIELLVVIAVLMILIAVIFLALNRSRAKAEDSRTLQTLGGFKTTATEEYATSGSFTSVCTSSGAGSMIETLADQKNLDATDYTCAASQSEFTAIFPLKAEKGYWCVDGTGSAGKVESLQLPLDGPYRCSHVSGQSGNTSPTLTLNNSVNCTSGPASVYAPWQLCVLPPGMAGNYPPGTTTISSGGSNYFGFESPGITALDAEDGDISDRISRHYAMTEPGRFLNFSAQLASALSFGLFTPCTDNRIEITYSITDSDGNSVSSIPRWVIFCSGASGAESPTNQPPAISFNGPETAYFDPFNCTSGECNMEYTAYDAEDGDITDRVISMFMHRSFSGGQCTVRISYHVYDDGGLEDLRERTFIFPSSEGNCPYFNNTSSPY